MNTREVAEFLGPFPPFDVLPEDELTAVAESGELRTYVDGENILVEDAEPADHLYVVREGAIELVHQAMNVWMGVKPDVVFRWNRSARYRDAMIMFSGATGNQPSQ